MKIYNSQINTHIIDHGRRNAGANVTRRIYIRVESQRELGSKINGGKRLYLKICKFLSNVIAACFHVLGLKMARLIPSLSSPYCSDFTNTYFLEKHSELFGFISLGKSMLLLPHLTLKLRNVGPT